MKKRHRAANSARALSKPVRVLESVPAPGQIVSYVDQIVLYAPSSIKFSYFSYRNALLGGFDVFHVHWPEWLIRHNTHLGSLLKQLLFFLLLVRLKLSGVPIVRTVHNVQPHENGNACERKLIAWLEAMTQYQVVLNDCVAPKTSHEAVIIPHGDYREVFRDEPRSQKVRGRVLLFGRIKPYKGAIELIRAASDISEPDVSIRIVGAPTAEMRDQIGAELAAGTGRGAEVSVDLRTVTDHELVKEISQAELIVLPYQDAGNGNSGAALLALSLDRPILTMRSCVMEGLAKECGEAWVAMVDHEISAVDIEGALLHWRNLGDCGRPSLKGRDWRTVAEKYSQVFIGAAQDCST